MDERRWTAEEEAMFCKMADAGETASAISRRIDRALGSVLARLSLWRSEHRRVPQPRHDPSTAEAAMLAKVEADGGYPRAVICGGATYWVGMHGQPWVGPAAPPPPAKPLTRPRAA